jgi:hypothetical protein
VPTIENALFQPSVLHMISRRSPVLGTVMISGSSFRLMMPARYSVSALQATI